MTNEQVLMAKDNPQPPKILPCKICATEAVFFGTYKGKFRDQVFTLYRCPACNYTFLGNPWLDYPSIYDENYYQGHGADPLVDYVFELESPEQTIRQYEWRGIVDLVRSCVPLGPETRWLDFGCGNAGLVRYGRKHTDCSIWGYDEGWILEKARKMDIPLLTSDELHSLQGSFHVITAVEVLEHLPDPLEQLRQIRALLKPGGFFFFTTGNAEPFRNKFFEWRYLIPEVHVGFFEPGTVARAFHETGFRPEFRGFMPGFADIIRFKVLKTLKLRRVAWWERLIPWGLLSRIVDRRFRVTAHPVGWAA